MCVVIPFVLDARLLVDAPAGVTQEEGYTGFLIHLPSAVLALVFIARRIQPSLSLVDREVEFCVLRINRSPLVGHVLLLFCFVVVVFVRKNPSSWWRLIMRKFKENSERISL